MAKNLRYRLGIDLGTTSIGTALVELDGPEKNPHPTNILHLGVRIFDDGRDPKSKKAKRSFSQRSQASTKNA